jgi:predicted cupin superfamily sugar epimerase
MSQNSAYWIKKLDLFAHPEGGHMRETFVSSEKVFRENNLLESRNASSSIYYLLEGADISPFHRSTSDEIWYFHKGEPYFIHVIQEDGTLEILELSDSETGQLSHTIKANLWLAKSLKNTSGFALTSCVVAPGFHPSDYETAKKDELKTAYPHLEEFIERLCKN